jgi:hypothetical protein
MGFLHLGWESATFEDEGLCKPLAELSPQWAAVGQVVDLSRPGLPTVQRVLGWHPLHVAAMSGGRARGSCGAGWRVHGTVDVVVAWMPRGHVLCAVRCLVGQYS